MKPPYLSNGTTYGTDSAGNRICTGSQMGRRQHLPPVGASPRLHLRRVPFVDQCYDQGGAYWGCPANLFCAWSEGVEIYLRANSRQDARSKVLLLVPQAKFYR